MQRALVFTQVLVLALGSLGCGARTGLITGMPPDTTVTETCQWGFCLSRPFCADSRPIGGGSSAAFGPGVRCVQGPDDGAFVRSDCLVPPPGGGPSFCELTILDPLPGRAAEEVPIWGPNGEEVTIYCDRPPVAACEGLVQTVGFNSQEPDACLLSDDAWDAYWSSDLFDRVPAGGHVPFPWEERTEPRFPGPSCGALRNEVCPSPSGIDGATTRDEWCGSRTPIPTMPGRFFCNYSSETGHLEEFSCAKTSVLTRPRFAVVADPFDPSVASRAAGALGGAYCNLLGPRAQLGALPPDAPFIVPATMGVFANAPYVVFARRDVSPARVCEEQRPNTGVAMELHDPGVAQGGQLAVVLDGSTLEMERLAGAGPPATMPVIGRAAVFIGPEGGFDLTELELEQANERVEYTDSSGAYEVRDGVLRLADIWSGSYSGATSSPNVIMTAATASVVMSLQFDGMPFTLPLEPESPPEGEFDGVDRATLRAEFTDPPSDAHFTLTLRLQLEPRLAADIRSVSYDQECRPLPGGGVGSVLVAEGEGSRTGSLYWGLSTDPLPGETSELGVTYQTGGSARFELPLGAPSDPPYNLSLTLLSEGQVGRDTRSIPAPTDTTPPEIEAVTVRGGCLWPPDHRYVAFELGDEIQATASDVCSPETRVRIANVVSDQADDARGTGDGSTVRDVRFGDSGLCVRAERDGRGRASRRYTVTVEATDAFGNASYRDVVIEVPHDRSAHCTGTDLEARVDEADADVACTFPEVPPLAAPVSPRARRSTMPASPPSAAASACSVRAPGRPRGVGFGLVLLGLAVLRRRRVARRTNTRDES